MVQTMYPHLPVDEFLTYNTFQSLFFMLLLHFSLRIALRRLCPTPPPLIPGKEEGEGEGKDTTSGVSIEAIVVKSEEEVGVHAG